MPYLAARVIQPGLCNSILLRPKNASNNRIFDDFGTHHPDWSGLCFRAKIIEITLLFCLFDPHCIDRSLGVGLSRILLHKPGSITLRNIEKRLFTFTPNQFFLPLHEYFRQAYYCDINKINQRHTGHNRR